MRTSSILCLILVALLTVCPALAQTAPSSVVAYGRVVPGEQIMALTLPYFQSAPQVVAKLLVSVGDAVTADQVLAVSDKHATALANVEETQAHVAALTARLALVREGAKPEDVAAQADLVASQEYDVTQARQQLERSTALHQRSDVSEAQWLNDTARLGSLENQLAMNRHKLSSMQHPRPNDIAEAQADLDEAKAAVSIAQASLALTELRAPSAGQILKIVTYPGEQPGDRGVILFGDTSNMEIKAELDISDVRYVRVGALAKATAQAWTGALTGKVARIAPRVDRSSILPPSTFASVDRRVVEVTVKLDHPERAAALSGAEAIVMIATSP